MNRLGPLLALAAPFAAVILAIAGLILLRRQSWAAGTVSVMTALAILVADLRILDKYVISQPLARPSRRVLIQAGSWTTVIGLSSVALIYVIPGTRGASDDRVGAVAWICSVLLGLVTVWLTDVKPDPVRRAVTWVRAHRTELALLLAVLLVALVVRTIALPAHPYPWSGDEASVAREASRIVSGETTRLFQTGWSDQPSLSFIPTAVLQFVLGNGMLATRLTSALFGVLAVVAVFLVARELFGRSIALLSSAFLATLPYHVHFSRLGFQNVLDSFTSSAVVWLAVRAVNRRDPRYYYTAGAAVGLTIYSYPGTRLALGLGVVALLYSLYRARPGDDRWAWHLLLFVGAALLSAAPQALYFAVHPGRFLSRLGQESILLNGWLMEQAGHTAIGAVRPLLKQLTDTLLTFVAKPAAGNLFNSPYPYLTLPEGLLFLAGIAYASARLWTPRSFILLFWFGIVILLGGVLTMNPPATTRLLATTPVVAILMALGLWTLVEQVRMRGLLTATVPICLVVVSAIAYQNVRFYLSEYRTQMYFQDAHAEYAMEVGLLARHMTTDCHLYIVGAPRVFSSFPTLRYLVPHHTLIDLAAPDVPHLERDDGACAAFFAIPENRPLLRDLQRRYRDGSGGVVYRKTRPDEVLFDYYLVTR